MKKKGFLFVISGPSAVGKTSVANELLKQKKINLQRIITCTTRTKRNGEVEGVDYFFMSKDEFLRYSENGDFAEMSEVYGNYYGILVSTIKEKIEQGINALLVINWEGFLKIKRSFKENVIGFFLLPPSLKDLETRIRSRGTDSEDIIKQRLNMITEDMRHKDEFDFRVKNVKIADATSEIFEKIANITASC
jgi:guanylate kinase